METSVKEQAMKLMAKQLFAMIATDEKSRRDPAFTALMKLFSDIDGDNFQMHLVAGNEEIEHRIVFRFKTKDGVHHTGEFL